MAGHIVPEVKVGFGPCPEESVDKDNEAPLPAVEGAAKGSAIAPTTKQRKRQ